MSRGCAGSTRAVRNAMSPRLLIAEQSKLNGSNPSAALSTTLVNTYPCAKAGEASPTTIANAVPSPRALRTPILAADDSNHTRESLFTVPPQVARCQIPGDRGGPTGDRL